jgi:hypothetical protein
VTRDACKFFTRRVYCPYPDYGARLVLWRGLIERHGGIIDHHFNLSTLATLTKDYSAGAIEDAVKLVLTVQRVRKVSYVKITDKHLKSWLCGFVSVRFQVLPY